MSVKARLPWSPCCWETGMIEIQSLVTSVIFIYMIIMWNLSVTWYLPQSSPSVKTLPALHTLWIQIRLSPFVFSNNNHQTGNLTTITITIYFIHPSGKLKLSFDRTMIIYNKELITLLTLKVLSRKGVHPLMSHHFNLAKESVLTLTDTFHL